MTTEDPIVRASNNSHTTDPRGAIDHNNVGAKDRPGKNVLDAPPFTHGQRLGHGSDQALGVHLTQGFLDAAGPIDEWTRKFSDRSILRLVGQEHADVILSVNEKKETVFTLTNQDSIKYGIQTMPAPGYNSVPPDAAYIVPILTCMSRWQYYMRLMPDSRPFKNEVDLEFYRLQSLEEYDDEGNLVLKINSPNLKIDGVVDCVASTEHYYGVRLANRTSKDLYAYIFGFSTTSLTIYDMSFGSFNSNQTDPTLRKNTEIKIGYGPESPYPLMFEVDEGMDKDVDIIKVFVSTEPIDCQTIRQEDPFEGHRSTSEGEFEQFFKKGCLWDVFTATIVQRPPPEGEEPTPAKHPEETTTKPSTEPTHVPESNNVPSSSPATNSTQFTGGSKERVLVQARSAAETSSTWFRTPPLTKELLGSISSMQLRTLAKQQGPVGATATDETGAYFEISVIGSEDLPKLLSPDAETTMTYKSHSAPATLNCEWANGVVFEKGHELWSKLEVGDCFEVSVCARGRGWGNNAEQGELAFW